MVDQQLQLTFDPVESSYGKVGFTQCRASDGQRVYGIGLAVRAGRISGRGQSMGERPRRGIRRGRYGATERRSRGSAASNPPAGSDRCSRPGSAPGNPGARAPVAPERTRRGCLGDHLAWAVTLTRTGDRLAASLADGRIRCWDLLVGRLRWEAKAHAGPGRSLILETTGNLRFTAWTNVGVWRRLHRPVDRLVEGGP